MTDAPATNADGPARADGSAREAGIGLFCGTFNPIHVGHMILAECARDQFQLEKVIFVTSPQPPHRPNEKLLDAAARHEMVSAAVSDNPGFAASSFELERSGPSYTFYTVQHFYEQFPHHQIAFLIGEDNLPKVRNWHRASELLQICRLLVAPRAMREQPMPERPDAARVDGADPDATANSARSGKLCDAQVHFIDFPHVEVSATSIRHRIRCGLSVRYMVPPAVAQILATKQYYR